MSFCGHGRAASRARFADRLGRKATIIGGSALTILFGFIYPQLSQPVAFVGQASPAAFDLHSRSAALRRLHAGTVPHRRTASRHGNLQHARPRRDHRLPFIVVSLFRTTASAA